MQKLIRFIRSNPSLALLIGALGLAVFSYHPLVTLGTISGVHIDLSLFYVVVLAATVASLPLLWRKRQLLARSPALALLYGFAGFVSLSSWWSPNQTRALITAGFGLLMVMLASIIALRYRELLRHKRIILGMLTGAYALALAWALWQLVGDWFGVPVALTLLPTMYDGSVFGVARPTAFALEPQFFGSLLLVPIGYVLHRVLNAKVTRWEYLHLALLVAMLLLTLSRGAYIGLAVLVLVLLAGHVSLWQRWLRVAGIMVASLAITLSLVFVGGTIRPDNTSGYGAVRGVVEHLSLGVVKLPSEKKAKKGYVEASTNSRLIMSGKALDLWQSNPATLLFGVGIGGFGASLPKPDPGHVVNNYYVELLAETGLVGAVLFVAALATLLYQLVRRKWWLPVAILVGLLAQMAFFSGNANSIHVWMIIGLAAGMVLTQKNATID